MLEVVTEEWKVIKRPASVRIVNDGLRKSIDWVEVSEENKDDGPGDDGIFSRYTINVNEPLTAPYVNIWVRASDPFKSVKIDVIHPITG